MIMPNERTSYKEVYRSFSAVGLYAEKRIDIRGVTPSGRPDYCVYGAPGISLTGSHFWVEIKYASGNGKTNFAFADISQDQRDWMAYGPPIDSRNTSGLYDPNWALKCWLWLFFGKGITSKDCPRQAHLIPWVDWLEIEERFTDAGLSGMAYIRPKMVVHREMGLSAKEQLAQYALEWQGNGVWKFPAGHQIWNTLNGIVPEEWTLSKPSEMPLRMPLMPEPSFASS
jgi:hypothetical protein